ncbi:MAG: type IV pili methyl-accepting chemotaxis transducer N-terminal domain-containing protein [Pseudomonadota bacterium]
MRTGLTKRISAGLVVAGLLGPVGVPALAGGPVEMTPSTIAIRIDLAGRQRMLLERMSKYFCYARSGVDAATSVAKLTKAMDLFDQTHKGFKKGDPSQKIFAEKRDGPKKSWNSVNLMWLPLQGIYNGALAGEFVSEEDFGQSVGLALEARKRANDMVAQLRASYTEDLGDGGFGSALLLDLYGRQRMLSQKLAKEVCLVARGFEPDSMPGELAATFDLFETSLAAFIDGMPIAGVPKPPTPAIASQLSIANTEWQAVRPIGAAVVAGQAVSLRDLALFAVGTDRFLVEMNKAVKLLAAHEGSSS